MKPVLLALILAAAVTYPAATFGQKPANPETDPKITQAYSLLIQRRVKVQAELESVVSEYSSDHFIAKRLQFEFDELKSEMKKMIEVDETKISKLTPGYGSLILRRVALATEVHVLKEEAGPEWPTFKERQRELELLDKEIAKVMR